MLELIGLAIVVTGISALARGRGASPVLAGSIAVGGYVLIRIVAMFLVASDDARLLLLVLGWAWIAVVAGYFRFVVGRRLPKPDSKWNCSNCRYLNNASSVVCEACQQPWKAA